MSVDHASLGRSPMRKGCVASSVIVALSTSVAVVSALAQTRSAVPAATERFDVTSVKSNKGPVEAGMSLVPRPAGFSARNVTLRLLVMLAYGVREFDIVGGPDWLARDRFDLAGTIESPDKADPAARARMLQALLPTVSNCACITSSASWRCTRCSRREPIASWVRGCVPSPGSA